MPSSLLLRRVLQAKLSPPIPALPSLPWMMVQLSANAQRPLNLPLVSKSSPMSYTFAIENPLHIVILAPSLLFILRPLLVPPQLFHLYLHALSWSPPTAMLIQLWTLREQPTQLSSGNAFSLNSRYTMKISLDSASIAPKSAKLRSGTHYQTISYFGWFASKVTVLGV
ncbi:hypothetical protein M405DRAFT_445503 [Rhizopogon salebrosus TDB-379]|nr:hypothetical protein M405DRAFT_445503 [Rhizopogon salebrosus TDB-379]